MPDHVETELKLKLINPAGQSDGWQAFRECAFWKQLAPAEAWATVAMEAVYFDTPDQALKQAGIAYRVRKEGEEWVATVKTGGSSGGGLHRRQEYNVIVADSEPRIDAFAGLPVGSQLQEAIGQQPLLPIHKTVFERKLAQVEYTNSRIELAIDEGLIIAGEQTEPIREIELELKAGDPADLLRLGAELSREAVLVPEPKSKYYRALLLGGMAEPEQSDQLAGLKGSEAVAEGVAALLVTAISSLFAAYEAFLLEPDVPRRTHQMRVKIRHLRSLLLLARPCISDADYLHWKQVLGEWGRVFGALRDVDVIAAEWEALCSSPYIAFDSKPWLGENISKRRSEELEKVLTALRQSSLGSLLFELWAWAESNPWITAEYPSTIGEFARWRLRHWLTSMLSAAKKAAWEDDEATHTLRLKMKRVRYGLAALAFYQDNRSEKLLLRLKDLQTLFGALSDRATSGRVLAGMSRKATRAVYRDIGMLLGWQAHGGQAARTQVEKRWKKLKRAARRWLIH